MPHSHRRYRSGQYLFHSYSDWLVDFGSFRRWERRHLLEVSLRHSFSRRLESLGRVCFPRGETFQRRYSLRTPGFFPQASETSVWRRGRRPGMRRKANDRFAPAPHAIERYWRFPPARGRVPVPGRWPILCPSRIVKGLRSGSLKPRVRKTIHGVFPGQWSSHAPSPLQSDARTDVF